MADDETKSDASAFDVVVLQGRTEDGAGLRALRARPDRIDLAELRPTREGQPLGPTSELVGLRPRGPSGLLYDVDVHYASQQSAAQQQTGHGGPARVSNALYRRNWERIFATSSSAASDDGSDDDLN